MAPATSPTSYQQCLFNVLSLDRDDDHTTPLTYYKLYCILKIVDLKQVNFTACTLHLNKAMDRKKKLQGKKKASERGCEGWMTGSPGSGNGAKPGRRDVFLGVEAHFRLVGTHCGDTAGSLSGRASGPRAGRVAVRWGTRAPSVWLLCPLLDLPHAYLLTSWEGQGTDALLPKGWSITFLFVPDLVTGHT